MIEILGVHFATQKKSELYETINKFITSNEKSRTVFTPNAEMLCEASTNEKYRNVLNSASLLIPDGIGINLAFKRMGIEAPERTTGIDAAEFILGQASMQGLRIFLLGGKPHVAKMARIKLEAIYPNIIICGTDHGYFNKSPHSRENKETICKINRSKADILFVCFGAPLQELWIAQNSKKFSSVKLSIGLGGCLDVWSGKISRAPKFLRRLGLEWIYRILRQPKRLKRLPRLVRFVLSVNKERKKQCKDS